MDVRSRAGDHPRRVLNGGRKLFSTLGNASLTVSNALTVATQEQEYWGEYPLDLSERLYAWRHGFTSRDHVLLELANNDPDGYLSYLQQARQVHPAMNEEYLDVLRNKVAFYNATRPYVDCVPELYGTIRGGEFEPSFDYSGSDTVPELVCTEGDVIVKPITGTMGRDVYHVSDDGSAFRVNDDRVSAAELRDLRGELDRHLVSEFVHQHEYADAIYPDATNTVRMLTVADPDSRVPFLASAVHRFGSDATGPTDNWSGGGFAAPIDVESGRLDRLHTYSTADGLERLTDHPVTGARVAGERIPEWDRMRSTVLEVADIHAEIPYIGWDVVLSGDGPVVLEGNAAPHLALQQLGSGLLENERVRRFFDRA